MTDNNDTDSPRDLLAHPVAAVGGLFSALATMWEPLFRLFGDLMLSLDTLMPMSSIIARYVAPQVAGIPEGTARAVMLVVASLYIARLADKTIENFTDS